MDTTTNGRLFFDGSCHGNMLFLGNSDPIFRVPRSLLNMAAEETSKRRPFFSITDELIDDHDFYDEQSPEKKRRLTAEQVHLLEKSFEAENKLEPERKTQLAKKLGLQPRQVAVWFQNRRARWKTKQLERDYDLLKASYDSLLSDYNAVVNDNEKLKSELVVCLTEKSQVKEEILGGMMVMVGQQKSEPLLPATTTTTTTDDANIASIHFNVKVEDRLSTGSGGSAVLDDQDCLQLVDSGDSYFPNDDYGGCMGPIDGSFQSEGDDGSDDNRSYFSDVFATTTDQQHEETHQQMGWWVWS